MAATYLGMTKDALKYKALDGQLPSVRIDKKYRFDREDLDRYIEDHKVPFRGEEFRRIGTISAPNPMRKTEPYRTPGPSTIDSKQHRLGAHKTREQKREEMLEKAGSENPDS
jgi:excisionase family DNA binding protein